MLLWIQSILRGDIAHCEEIASSSSARSSKTLIPATQGTRQLPPEFYQNDPQHGHVRVKNVNNSSLPSKPVASSTITPRLHDKEFQQHFSSGFLPLAAAGGMGIVLFFLFKSYSVGKNMEKARALLAIVDKQVRSNELVKKVVGNTYATGTFTIDVEEKQALGFYRNYAYDIDSHGKVHFEATRPNEGAPWDFQYVILEFKAQDFHLKRKLALQRSILEAKMGNASSEVASSETSSSGSAKKNDDEKIQYREGSEKETEVEPVLDEKMEKEIESALADLPADVSEQGNKIYIRLFDKRPVELK
jgi:hypothetical protein